MTSSRRLPVPRVRSRRLKTGVGCVLLAGLTVLNAPLRAASTLLAVAPSGASATVSIQVTGSGFDLTAANHEVTFRATTGETAVAVPTAVVMVDPVRGLRRLTLRVPAGLPIGRADLTVLNRITGESITGLWLEVVALTVPDVRSGAPGATNLRVRITGSANAKFAPGSRAVFGTGVTVVSTTVESPASVMATITIAAGAAVGPRAVTVITTTQTVTLPDGFLVSATPPSNRDPIASANGPYSGAAAQLISFSSTGSSDPDADPLQFAWTFGDGTTATDANPQHAYATAGTYSATLALSDGRGGTASATSSVVVVPPPNRPPTAVVNGPYAGNTGDPIVFSSAGSTDPDGDALQFAWDFGDTGTSIEANPQHAYLMPGPFTVLLTVTDGRGGSASASTQAAVTTRVTLVSLLVEPPALRYSDLNLTTALVVTGRFSDGSERNLTVGSTGTTYTSSAVQIVTASLDGVVTSIGNGGASIVVANGGIAQAVPVVVEQGVILQALELTPPSMTLREIGSSAPTTLRGRFSDGSLRDLTRDPGTRYSIDEVTTASISSVGLVNALAPGAATVTARHGGLSATAQVRVIVTEGSGFLRGEVFDDSRGLPLSGVTATLIVSGGAAVANPSPISSDDRGRFTLPAAAGAAFVKVERSGFTTVERPADLGRNAVVTLLDSRLTPVDPRVNALQSVFGGEARSTDASASVSVPSGSLDQDVSLRVTPISAQGLQGVLPVGWSPIAAVDLQPAGRRLAQGATLRLPHVDTLLSGSSVALVRYDDAAHRWVAAGPGRVSDDQRTVSATIEVTGQFALVVPDETPMTPPPAVPGEALAGVAGVVVPDTSTAAGQVTPRSAPPGEGARAVGTLILQPPAPLSSGAVLRARVSEQFDLLDTSRIVPLQFVQDVVLYARPRLGTAGTLAARLPITPSLPFTIQQLSLGTVRLDVTIAEPTASSAIVGADGGSVTDAAGNVLELPAGALAADLALGLLPLSAGQISTPVPDGFTLLGAVFVDLVGASFDQPARLSIPRPSALALSAQVLVARVITDNAGGRRLQIVGVGAVSASRVSVQTALGAIAFEGVRGGGEFVFLQPAQPLGFITGLVTAPAAGPQALALVTANTAPFAYLTASAGTFVVAGRAGTPTTVAAIEPTGAAASGAATLAAINDIAALNLTLTQTAPVVTATSPAMNAVNVPLDASVIVDFSKPIDPATVLSSSVVLTAGQTAITAQAVLSANRRRLTVSPVAPLAGLTAFTLTLTSGIRDLAGVGLAGFTPLGFTTLDPSKATALALGVITAELPDEDGLSLVTGGPGAAEPSSAVVGTNVRTQETSTVLASADGSFRLRLSVVVGDELTLTLRGTNGRETTLAITQFSATDGTTSVGTSGGTIQGAGGRVGRVLPRALGAAGVFGIDAATGAPPVVLPAPFAPVDRFSLRLEGAAFRRLDSLTVTEAQGRFSPGMSFSAPFAASGSLTVPADFLVSASLRFNAVAVDRDGARHAASGATVVVAGSPDGAAVETGFGDQFPTVFLTTPRQVIPTQIVGVSALAPAARIDIDLPAGPAFASGHTAILTRVVEVNGQPKLSLVDRFAPIDIGGVARLRTAGRDLPGATRGGDYEAVSGPVAFVTGRASGPAAVVTVDGSPFVFETDGANGSFTLPVVADAPFVLRFFDAATGAALGSANGQAPGAGATRDVGLPLASATGTLAISAQPDARSVVDIGTPLVFTFSELVDRTTVTANAFVVTDAAGVRVFGRVAISDDGRTVTFVPLRRWKYGSRYRYGVATSVVAASGARQAQALSSEFRTFAPRIVGTATVNGVSDVAVSENVAVLGTASGAAVVDVARSDAPTIVANIPLAGGAGAVALQATPIRNRNGVDTPAPIAVVAVGDSSIAGTVQTYSLAAPSAPVLLGLTQVTTPIGQIPPAGVSAAPGVPNGLTVDTAGRAMAAIRDLGVQTVSLGQAIPTSPTNPAAGLGPRFPATGAGDAAQVAFLGDRVLMAGRAGLTVLNSTSLEAISTVTSGGPLTGVAALAGFGFDLDGDTHVGADEQFDLAVAGDDAGVLQFYRLRSDAPPELISAVRLPGSAATGGVTLDATERVAYVGGGAAGLILVDLSGPSSIQPIDGDRDGVDDRILGVVDTRGSAGRVALDLGRGIGYVADGPGGLTIAQLTPARVRFDSVVRDPVLGRQGDEESIVQTRLAFASDEAVGVTLTAAIPSGQTVSLAIDETPDAGSARRLSFDNGALSTPLVGGTHTVNVLIDRSAALGAGRAILRVQAPDGTPMASFDFQLQVADAPERALTSLALSPDAIVMGNDEDERQLAVMGVLADGRTLNLTRGVTGTLYSVANPHIAFVTPDGLLVPVAGGRTEVYAQRGSRVAVAGVRVLRSAELEAFGVAQTHLTLTAPGATNSLGAVARFTDGTSSTGLRGFATFESSNNSVATVDTNGAVTAVGQGIAVISVRRGTVTVQAQVAVEFRTPANLSGIDLAPFGSTVRTDAGEADARASVTGTGSLEGITVTFVVAGATVASGVTDYSGVALARIPRLTTPGIVNVTATVMNPATASVLSDSEALTVVNGSVDAEPNNDVASAVPIAVGRQLAGVLGGTDTRDMFRSENRISGTLTAIVALSAATDPASVRLVFLSSDGTEVRRTTPVDRLTRLAQSISSGASFVAVESTGAAVDYTLSMRYQQDPLAITAVSPAGGPPGTPVTIVGTGFSLDASDVRVLFGGIAGRVVSSSPTTINAIVPANAVDGPITVIAADGRSIGPAFITGNAGPRPPSTLIAGTPEIRFDPTSGQVVDLKRLTVFIDPQATTQQVAALAANLGGTVVGQIPALNSYVMEFSSIGTLAALEAVVRQLQASTLVTRVVRVERQELESTRIDARDSAATIAGTTIPLGIAYTQGRVFDAIEAIRETPPFVGFAAPFVPVKIAVVDTGFSPWSIEDFQSAGQNIVQLFRPNATGVFSQVPIGIGSDPDGHGTEVTSIIAGLNNGSGRLSGGFGGLFQPDEATFQVHVYGATDSFGDLWSTAIFTALADIADQADVDVVNLSNGHDWPGSSPAFLATKAAYRDAFALMGGRTLVVTSAGNGGVQAQFHTSSVLEMDLPFVMAIGATAVANIDGSGESADARAVYNGSPLSQASAPCAVGVNAGGSNCGPGVTMGAPGEDVLVATRGAPGFTTGAGTSFASPMVASIAALLRAIGPVSATPSLLRTLLVDSGDDITPIWGTGQTIRRLNALNAVRLFLPSSAPQMIYLSDQSADNGAGSPGRIIGIDIDPLNGQRPTPPNPDVVIPLTFSKLASNGATVTFQGSNPTSLLVAPTGQHLYAVVQGGSAIGDGVLVVNTRSNRAVDFVPFSGAGFPSNGGGAAPVLASSLRPGMVFSKDGRLLYVATGSGLTVINTVTDKVVERFSDLPSEYSLLAATAPANGMLTRLAAIANVVHLGAAGRAGTGLTGLAVSPDGKVLYGALHTGSGGGQQPGGLLAINIDLYQDAKPMEPGLQTDLTNFLAPITTPAVSMQGAGGFLGGDEPAAVAVSRDGDHVYLVNGGLNFFDSIPPADLDLNRYNFLLIGPAMSALGLPGGIAGVMAATAAFMNTSNQLYNALLADIRQQAESGVTFISAPGVTAVFGAASAGAAPPAQEWLFTSDIGFGWNPTPVNGGSVVNQFRFHDVVAKRPFDMALRPDGKRAILPYFQTGNFGVVDLDAQNGFDAPPASTPKPAFASLPDTLFQGVVGVTTAIRLDNHLWPSRGAFHSNNLPVPSPDEHRLFAWHAEYAQNGRFAVASHAGNGVPRVVNTTIPDFTRDIDQRLAIAELGEINGATATIVEDGQTLTVGVGDAVQLKRGGGALSIIDDRAISRDFGLHLGDSVTATNGTERPYYSTSPICTTNNGASPPRCATEAVTTLVDYSANGTTTRFHRPRGVTVQPFLAVESPRFGDHVTRATALQIVWRDARIRELFVTLRDPDNVVSGEPATLNQLGGGLIQQQIDTMTSAVRFGDLFTPALSPVQGKHYNVRIQVLIQTPSPDVLSTVDFDVVFDDQSGPITATSDSLELRPVLVPVLTVPTGTGQFRQLTVKFKPADGSAAQDVTASADTTYLWLGDPAGQLIRTSNPLVNTLMELASVDVSAIINDIKAKLSAAGVPVNFQLANLNVDSAGHLTVSSAGLQVVQAVHRRNGTFLFSAPTLVLAGLELSKIDLEPSSLLNNIASATGVETLGKKLADKLGKKVNTPLILTATDPGFFTFLDNTGEVELEDVEFTFLGTGTISIDDVLKAIEPLVRKAMTKALGGPLSPTAQLGGRVGAKVLMKLIDEAIEEVTIRFVDLSSSNTAVATVNDGLLYKGDVTAAGPGLAAIEGELKLGDFGSAKDTVPVFVLPNLTEAIIEPANSLICVTDSGPGPKISTLASLRISDTITFTPQQFGLTGDGLKLAELLVPAFLPTGTFHDVTFTVGSFKFGFRGTINVSSAGVTWVDPELRFYVPNIPGVTNRYEFFPAGDPQAAGIVHTDDVETFAVHLAHQQQVGRNQINNFVAIPGLGSVQGIGSVRVTNLCSTPFVVKELENTSLLVSPGDSLNYVVTVGNPNSFAVDNISVQDIATYVASVPVGDPAQDIIEVTQIIPVATLAPHAFVEVRFIVPTFGGSFGTITNRATVTGAAGVINVTPCQVDPTKPGCTPVCLNPPCVPPPPPPPPAQIPPCTQNPNAPGCFCLLHPNAPECITRPPDVTIVPLGAPFITEMVLAPQRDWNDSAGGNGVPFDGTPGNGVVDGNDAWIEVTSLTGATFWTLRLTDAAGQTFTKLVGPPIIGAAVHVVSGFNVGVSPIVQVQVIDNNGLIRQTVDIATIETVLGPSTGAADESLTWSVFGTPTTLMQQFLRRPATIGVFNPF